MSELSVVEICAGAGGQSLGLHLAGFAHRAAVELDPMAASTLRKNFARLALANGSEPPVVAVGDVANPEVWTPGDFEGVDLLAGGVPCPPFSIAGKRLGASDERDLFAWAVELADTVKPAALMLENVRGLSMPRFAGYRQAVIDRLNDLGYVADWHLLEARDYGVPQLRPRTVLVALHEDAAGGFEWPEAKPTTETVGSLLFDLMAANGWRGAAAWADSADGIAPTIVGGSRKHGGADLGPTRAKQAWASMGVDALGIADEAPGAGLSIGFRPKLTTAMVARLQGWVGPEYEWNFEGTKTSRYRQIGNAFPPPVARAVGQSLANALRGTAPTRLEPKSVENHDEVYRVLRDHGAFLSQTSISKLLAGRFSNEQIAQHIEYLGRDFEMEVKTVRQETVHKLGTWKAFRGQDDHLRHEAFAVGGKRARIS